MAPPVTTSTNNSMPGYLGGERPRLLGRRIAAPGDVQVWPEQQEVAAIDRARLLVQDVEEAQWRTDCRECLHEPRDVGLRAAEAKERVGEIVTDAILHGGAVSKPGMRQA